MHMTGQKDILRDLKLTTDGGYITYGNLYVSNVA